MKTKYTNHGNRAFYGQCDRGRGMLRATALASITGALLSIIGPARAAGTSCDGDFDPAARYPVLPDLPGPDIHGEAGVVVFLQAHRAVVEVDGCFYDVGGRPLEVDSGELETVTLLVELPDRATGAEVFVTKNAHWVETLELEGDSFSYVLGPDASLGFEIASPNQPAPTVPVVITQPSEDPPEPT